MLSPAQNHRSFRRPRFGFTEVLLVAGILVFGGFTLVSESGQNFGTLLAGLEHVLRG
jgi:hypothetical protein